MGKFQEQYEVKSEVKNLNKSRKDNLAKYFLDLSKLTFTALVLGGVLSLSKDDVVNMSLGVMMVAGILLTILLARIGNNILK